MKKIIDSEIPELIKMIDDPETLKKSFDLKYV